MRSKILVATPHFGVQTGGVSTHTYNLYKRLSFRYGFNIVIVTADNKYSLINESKMKVYKLSYWFKFSNTPINPAWYFQLRKIIKAEKPEIVVGHTPVPFMADMAFLAKGNIPFILKYHHAGSMKKGKLLGDIIISLYEAVLLKMIFTKSEKILASSDFLRKNFLKKYSGKTITITPGVDVKRFKPRGFKTSNRILIITNLNKAERYKGLEFALKAMPLIIKKVDAKLVVIGDKGDDTSYYLNLCRKLGITKKVWFVGKIHHSKMAKEYQKSKVVLLPSLFDSCPNMLLEAMATGLPVIGTDSSGIADLIKDGENGYLFPPGDHKALADKVVDILSDNKLAVNMGINGLKKVKKEYTWDVKVRQTKKVIDTLLK